MVWQIGTPLTGQRFRVTDRPKQGLERYTTYSNWYLTAAQFSRLQKAWADASPRSVNWSHVVSHGWMSQCGSAPADTAHSRPRRLLRRRLGRTNINKPFGSPRRWRRVSNDLKLRWIIAILICHEHCVLLCGVCYHPCNYTLQTSDQKFHSDLLDEATLRVSIPRWSVPAESDEDHLTLSLCLRVLKLWKRSWSPYVRLVEKLRRVCQDIMTHAYLEVINSCSSLLLCEQVHFIAHRLHHHV